MRKETENKDEIIGKFSAKLNNIINNDPLKDLTVALNDNHLELETTPI